MPIDYIRADLNDELSMDSPTVRKFLQSGFVFGITTLEGAALVIGWGPWSKSAKAAGTGCSLFAPDFYMTDPEPWWHPAEYRVIAREFFAGSVVPKLKSEVNSDFEQRFQWLEPEFQSFEHQVAKIREKFENGGLEKAVPIVHAQAREIMTQARLAAILMRLGEVPPSLIPQGFWDESRGEGLLGATPERLFSIKKGQLETMALAGTRAKTANGNDADALFNDAKERREHQIVIDDLKTVLSVYGKVTVGETVVAELPTLFHLKTPISVAADVDDFETVARALHPTPALGVSPRAFGFANMKQWDHVSLRVRYGAPFGIKVRDKKTEIQDCLVAIRNVQWSKFQAPTLGSGCGFVEESITSKEWSELQLKRDSVKKVLHV